MEVTTTRQRIIEYLQRKQTASAGDISRALHLTAADIRHHLSVLESEGVVEVIRKKPTPGRGRPTSIYQLSKQALSHGLAGLSRLSKALLEETRDRLPAEGNEAFWRQVAQRMVSAEYQPVRNPSQRFVNAVQLLNQMNYQARWEARLDSPLVIFSHCPYADILPEHPELCRIDEHLLSLLLASPVHLTIRLQPNPQGVPQCIFAQKRFTSTNR